MNAELDELKIQIIMRRLTPSVERRDERGMAIAARTMCDRYGEKLLGLALEELCHLHPWLIEKAVEGLDPEKREIMQGEGLEIMAALIEDEGLVLEEHLRVCDQGIAMTHRAIAAIEAGCSPRMPGLKVGGNDSLEGLGLCRSPFWHPLLETQGSGVHFKVCGWGVASFLINGANGWFPGEGRSPKAVQKIKRLAAVVAPTLDAEKLLRRTRYDDRALLKMCELLHRALELRPDLFEEEES